MSEVTQRIKEKLGVADVLSSYIKLEKAGKNFKARCPFHNEKTASFFVSPDRDSYYCFGCGVSGDIFSFVEQFEGLDFSGALKVLAERAGVPLQEVSFEKKEAYTRLYALLEAATRFFESHLSRHKSVLDYLHTRMITEKTVHSFRLGFVEEPEAGSWRALHDHLLSMKFTVQEIERAGLIKKSSESNKGTATFYDVFRSRIMFPIFDTSGRVIAFSGRLFSSVSSPQRAGATASTEAPKYLNSPETPLFKKGSVLYGLDRAKLSIRKYDFSILVEGQFDLISAHQAGFTNTVAVSGTALTANHIDRLSRLSKNIVIALDADTAGIASTLKSARVALSAGMDVKVAVFPEGKDPADVISENIDTWKTAIRTATHVIEFLLTVTARTYTDARAFKKHVRDDVMPFLSLIQNAIDRSHFVGVIAARLGVDDALVDSEAQQVAFTETVQESTVPTQEKREILDRKTRLVRQMTALIKARTSDPAVITAHETVRTLLGYDPVTVSEGDDHDVFELEQAIDAYGGPTVHVNEILFALHEEILKERYADARAQLLSAEQAHNEEGITSALATCQGVSKELSELRSHRF